MISENVVIKCLPLTFQLVASLPWKGPGTSASQPHFLPPCLVSDPPGLHDSATGDGYDDADVLPVPEIPSSPEMSKNYFFLGEGGSARYSQTGEWAALWPVAYFLVMEKRNLDPSMLTFSLLSAPYP